MVCPTHCTPPPPRIIVYRRGARFSAPIRRKLGSIAGLPGTFLDALNRQDNPQPEDPNGLLLNYCRIYLCASVLDCPGVRGIFRVRNGGTILSKVVEDLEFFLDLAQDAIEERDWVIRELVKTLEAIELALLSGP